MAVEEQYKGYYDSIMVGKSYIDLRLSVQTCIADFLAQTFFGKDFSRVIYTNPEYAFRKRIERQANGIQGENIFLTDLKLPFCSFNLNGAPQIIKSVSASEWRGYYDETIEHRMHFINTLQKCTVQFYFNRSDDATVAFDIAQRESLSEYPIRYIQEVFWRNTTLQIPIWLTLKNLKAGNESFNESEWLERNHMFAITFDLEVEVARLHIHKGLNAVQLPFKWHATGNPDTWEDGEPAYYVQKCVLMWANKAMGIDISCPEEPTKEAEEVYEALIKNPQLAPADQMTLKQIQSVLPNEYTAEIVEGYFKDTTKIAFNRLAYVPEKTTIDEKGEVTAWIDFIVKPSTYQYWDYTEVVVPSRSKGTIKVKNCKDKYVQIDGLHPNSKYYIWFIAHDIEGNFATIPLEFTTPVWEKETVPSISSADAPLSELIDTVEVVKETKEAVDKEIQTTGENKTINPTEVKLRGLIGLEL